MSHLPIPISDELLLQVLALSKDATAIYNSEDLHIRFANDGMIAIWGKDRSVIGKTFEEAIPEIKGQPFTALLKNVWRTGETFKAKDTPANLIVDGTLQTFYFDFEYRAIKNAAGDTYCLLHTATNVTDRLKAWKSVKDREDELASGNEELRSLNDDYLAANEELADVNKQISCLFLKSSG